ncbi:hypothetical protein Acj9p195 [Acinetobacter phage Acj9]|uniref:Uncharacterized protein uvsY.-2 n=1 Tax=Acinetobacter phage Acj9 TaxID=760939 RepID=E5EPX9_9CAUD|nr:hypothetical protein Acj9p195 [Acinetobacter phage Acj9]ADG60095.1 conserved hypothetical protein [Acinetobacter phage Acj9]
MEHKICVVCKQPIDDALVVESIKGPVHPGQCYQHVEDMPMTESGDTLLAETELLL